HRPRLPCNASTPALFFFFSSRRRHTRFKCDWSSDVCSSDLAEIAERHGLLCLPGWTEDEVLQEAVAFCDLRRAFLVADPPGSDMAAATELAARLGGSGSANAALYFPPVSVGDPLTGGRPRSCARSGSVAGILARTGGGRG